MSEYKENEISMKKVEDEKSKSEVSSGSVYLDENSKKIMDIHLSKPVVASILKELSSNDILEPSLVKNISEMDSVELEEVVDSNYVSAKVAIQIKVKTDSDNYDIKFLNNQVENNEKVSLVLNIPLDATFYSEGEVIVSLKASAIVDNDSLKDSIEESLRANISKEEIDELKELSSSLESLQGEKSFEEFVMARGGSNAILKSIILEDFDENFDTGVLSLLNITNKEELVIKLMNDYSVSNSIFKDYIEYVATGKNDIFKSQEFLEDYIINNEHIYWDVESEERLASVFGLFHSKEVKSILIKRWKDSLVNNELDEKLKNIISYMENKDSSLITSYMINFSDLIPSLFQRVQKRDDKITNMMRIIDDSENFNYNSSGNIVLEDIEVQNFIISVISDLRLNLDEDSIAWIFNNCNTDLGSPEYPCFSLKESADELLKRFLQRPNCPSSIMSKYYLIDAEIASEILDSPKLETDEDLVKNLLLKTKMRLNKEVENSGWLSVYEKFKKFPYLSNQIKSSLDETLIGYSHKIKNSNSPSFLEEQWELIFYYKPGDISWPYGFSIEGKQYQLLTCIVSNEHVPNRIIEEYRLLSPQGENDPVYKKSVINKLESANSSEEDHKELYNSLSIFDKIEYLKDGMTSNNMSLDEVRQGWSDIVRNHLETMLNDDINTSLFFSNLVKISPEMFTSKFENEINLIKEEYKDKIFQYLKKKAVESSNSSELDMIIILCRGELGDKRQLFVSIDDISRNKLLSYVLNNHNYKVGDLRYWVEDSSKEIKNIDKFMGVFERELDQISNLAIPVSKEDFEAVAKNIRDLLKLEKSQIESVSSSIDALKQDISGIIAGKIIDMIESEQDEDVLDSYLLKYSNDKTIFMNIELSEEDHRDILVSFLRNRYTKFNQKKEVRQKILTEYGSLPIAV